MRIFYNFNNFIIFSALSQYCTEDFVGIVYKRQCEITVKTTFLFFQAQEICVTKFVIPVFSECYHGSPIKFLLALLFHRRQF